jgi:hypothetical protein
VGQRRDNQQDRIAQGIQSGKLNAGQTARLEKGEAGINHEVARTARLTAANSPARKRRRSIGSRTK